MGSVNLDNTGSGSAITLSSDGTSLLLDGTAVGGGGGATDINGLSDGYSVGGSVGLGSNALANDDGTSNMNTAVGVDALTTTTSGTQNTAVGSGALQNLTTGTFNSTVGRLSLYDVTTGALNVAIGYQAGLNITTGSRNTFIGYDVKGTSNVSNSVGLGYGARTGGSDAISVGTSYSSGASSFAAAIANNTSSYGATGANSIAMGDRSSASGSRGIAIGGYGALASGTSSLAFGYQATANQSYASGFGYASKAYGQYSWAGTESHASGLRSVAFGIGDSTTTYGAQHTSGVAIGYQAVTTADKQIALGSSTAQVKVSGTYTLPTADGTANQVLTTDGSGAVTFATAGGGGGLDLFVENYDGTSTLPTATGSNSITVGANAASSGTDSIALGRYVTASGFRSTALGRYTTASGLSSTAIGANAVAADQDSVSIGTAYSGGGAYSTAINIGNNTTSYGSGSTRAISMGQLSKATTAQGIAIGYNSVSTGVVATAIGPVVASGTYCYAIGIGAQASGTSSWATGLRTNTNSVIGKHVWSGVALSGNNDGSTQTGTTVLAIATTDATATALTTSADTADATNQLIVNNNSAYAFTGTIVARQKASEGTASAAWKVEGLIRREANAGTTVLVASTVTALSNAPSWGMALTADTTNGCLKIAATGAASTNIRWVATINTSEVLYA